MRIPLFLGSVFFGLAFSVSAQQHAAVVATPPPAAVHPAPTSTATGHVAAHPPSSAHPVHRLATSTSGVKTVAPRAKTPATAATRSVPPPALGGAVNPLGGFVNSVSGANAFCNRRGSYPLQGLNACAPTTGVVLPFSGGAIYVPVPYYLDSSATAEEQQPAEGQEEAANQPNDMNPPPAGEEGQIPEAGGPSPSSAARSGNSGITESLAQFVFVQRDGSKFYAVAYSFMNDKLHYVTKDGARRSVPLDSLDFDATQKSNEDLGNTINLPSLPASGVV
jgi:hypothetical protein